MEPTGIILHTQRLSTEDGPGIRTTVFFKGCPLRCAWCHNPESISLKPQVQWLENRCIGCHTCLETCRDGCLSNSGDGIVIDRQRCQAAATAPGSARPTPWNCSESAHRLPSYCLNCSKIRPTTGTGGRRYPVRRRTNVASGLCRRTPGKPESGGNPHRPGHMRPVRPPCVGASLPARRSVPVRSQATSTPPATASYTGQDNAIILDNLRWLASKSLTTRNGKRLWIRTPLIPGATDDSEKISLPSVASSPAN